MGWALLVTTTLRRSLHRDPWSRRACQCVVYRDLILGTGSTLGPHELEVGSLQKPKMTSIAPWVQMNLFLLRIFDCADGQTIMKVHSGNGSLNEKNEVEDKRFTTWDNWEGNCRTLYPHP